MPTVDPDKHVFKRTAQVRALIVCQTLKI